MKDCSNKTNNNENNNNNISSSDRVSYVVALFANTPVAANTFEVRFCAIDNNDVSDIK